MAHFACHLAALAQVSLDMYSLLPTTSTCASVDVPSGSIRGETVKFHGDATDGTVNALAVDFNDIVSILEIGRNQRNITISYGGYAIAETYNVTAIDWSDASDCSVISESTLAIENPVSDANFSMSSSVEFTRAAVGVTVYVVGGTDAKISLNPGDGTLSVPLCEVSASLSVLSYNLSYQNEGSFTMIVSAYNFVSNVTKIQTIDVYERIQDLVISGNTTVLTPPGSGTWSIEAGPFQLALENIVCVWNMGTNYPLSLIHISEPTRPY